jgi:hypothetical protein
MIIRYKKQYEERIDGISMIRVFRQLHLFDWNESIVLIRRDLYDNFYVKQDSMVC